MTDTSPLMNLQTKLSAHEAVAIAAAMKDVAAVDGTHPTEDEMIAEFVSAVGEDMGEAEPLPEMSPALLRQHIADPAVRRLALQALAVLAMADGKISPEEAKLNREYAAALGLAGDYEAIESEIVSLVKSGDIGPLFG